MMCWGGGGGGLKGRELNLRLNCYDSGLITGTSMEMFIKGLCSLWRGGGQGGKSFI